MTVALETKPAETDARSSGASAVDVRLDGVTKRFGDVLAVDALSLEIPKGTFFALLGPSGCGKTTTLRMIGGFEEPEEGAIEVAGRAVTGVPPYKRDVNTVFQSYALFPHLNVFENVAFGLRRKRVRDSQLRKRVAELLRLVGLEGLDRRKPRQLSGGQQQRVALSRALVNSPSVLLLDEPLGALDRKLRKQMQLELKRIQHELGLTFVHVTHDQEEAMTMADTIAVMNRGRIEQLGTPSELYETPRTAFVAGFLGVSNLLSGTADGDSRVRLDSGETVSVPPGRLAERQGRVAVGVRPEKVRLGAPQDADNSISGTLQETAYVGVSTQYIVETPAGDLIAYVQNDRPGHATAAAAGTPLTLSWSPDSTFVVDPPEEENA
jgi:spermidine/putrescine transport system ATP-binding protein